jgi:hypothetical protein
VKFAKKCCSYEFHPPLGKGGWGDFPMLPYNRRLKTKARSLRTNPTDAELHLWYRLRRKQVLGVEAIFQAVKNPS